VPLPSVDAQNRADMLVSVRQPDGTRSLPVWGSCAPSPALVIDVALSVFARRGRLPEPGEILFCDANTPIESVHLLLRRFLRARLFGRGHFVFCLVGVDALSYTMQCAVLEQLRTMLAEVSEGQGTASSHPL
jgi:hypothetical protein